MEERKCKKIKDSKNKWQNMAATAMAAMLMMGAESTTAAAWSPCNVLIVIVIWNQVLNQELENSSTSRMPQIFQIINRESSCDLIWCHYVFIFCLNIDVKSTRWLRSDDFKDKSLSAKKICRDNLQNCFNIKTNQRAILIVS